MGVDRHDVVFTFSSDTWADAQRRGMGRARDRFVESLTADPTVAHLLVADPYRSAAGRLRRLRSDPRFPKDESHRLVQPLRLARRDPFTPRGAERSYAWYDRWLRAAAGRLGMTDPVVVTSNPLIAGFAPLTWARAVTFYCCDDWTAYPPHERWWPLYEEAYARVRESGRRVGAVSVPLLERIAPTGPAILVPNGVEPTEWAQPAPAPAWFSSLPGPRLLYVGTLDGRVDVDQLAEVADHHASASLVLVGPLLDRPHFERLARRDNVHLAAPVSRPDVVALTSAADVCLLLHRRNQLTTAMSPLKLYEYLAAGRPVVATDLPPIRGADGDFVVLVDDDGGDAAAAVDRALQLGPMPEARRLVFLEANSWARRHRHLIALATA